MIRRTDGRSKGTRSQNLATTMEIERGLLAKYFVGAAVKRLTQVEVNPAKSNQHEFQGVQPIRRLLGDEDRKKIRTRFIWIADDDEPISDDKWLSWYDARRGKPRSAEYHLYYSSNSVTERMRSGDTLFFAMRQNGTCLVIVTPAGATSENQLLWLFGLASPGSDMKPVAFDARTTRLGFAARYILDELEIEVSEPALEFLDELLKPLGEKFPTTREFSSLARKSVPEFDPLLDPDRALMAWLQREELLFRRLERRVVSDRLRAGFVTSNQVDVESFLQFSLHVHNRRKSRAGQSLENHLEALFTLHRLRFSRGAETENHNRPDFLFPGISEYKDESFPTVRLTMLGAKSSCKDRWRQVLSEANRIRQKHLLTLEPGISVNQTLEMRSCALQLVVPSSLQQTYAAGQRDWLMSVANFLALVQGREKSR
jgi:hypothetical protein